jgi:hypothetical protein
VLLYNLATEVLVKKIEPSGRFLFLRLVLMSFMIYIFNSEQTSITKTRYFIMVDKLHWDLKLANFLRYLLANLTFGIAMWQVFSTPDGEADVVGEIMDFAALLIVIELDDYLMSTPSQQHCSQHFGDDFLKYEFSPEELQKLSDRLVTGDSKSICEWASQTFQWMIKFLFSYVVFAVIMLVNLGWIKNIELFSKTYWHGVYDFYTGGDHANE